MKIGFLLIAAVYCAFAAFTDGDVERNSLLWAILFVLIFIAKTLDDWRKP